MILIKATQGMNKELKVLFNEAKNNQQFINDMTAYDSTFSVPRNWLVDSEDVVIFLAVYQGYECGYLNGGLRAAGKKIEEYETDKREGCLECERQDKLWCKRPCPPYARPQM